MPTNRTLIAWCLVICLVVACDGLRHPLDDSETRPETQRQALEEAAATLDTIDESVMSGAAHDTEEWSAPDGCGTAPFGPTQGDVGVVLIRSYPVNSSSADSDSLIDEYVAYWDGEGESTSRSSPSMDPGAVARVEGIGYEMVSLAETVEIRAYTPCY